MYRLKLDETIDTTPTIAGFNVETVQVGNTPLMFWDASGDSKIRTLYRHYYPGYDGKIIL